MRCTSKEMGGKKKKMCQQACFQHNTGGHRRVWMEITANPIVVMVQVQSMEGIGPNKENIGNEREKKAPLKVFNTSTGSTH